MKERISALIDGDLEREEAQHCLQHLRQNGDLQSIWDTYHLIGDTLRGELLCGGLAQAKFAQRLRDEPTVLAQQARPSTLHSTRWYALSAAAGVAAVAIVAWIALPQFQGAPRVEQLAAGSAVAPAAQQQVMPAAAKAQYPATPLPTGVEDYLLAHQRFSPSGTIQGVAPYVRSVADERKGAAQ